MYGIVVNTTKGQFAAVSPRKMPLKKWAAQMMETTPASVANWRMRNETGWCDGGPNAHEEITLFPAYNVTVIW